MQSLWIAVKVALGTRQISIYVRRAKFKALCYLYLDLGSGYTYPPFVYSSCTLTHNTSRTLLMLLAVTPLLINLNNDEPAFYY